MIVPSGTRRTNDHVGDIEARRWATRLLEENCENPEFCLVYEEEEIIDEADQKAIYVEEEMGCVTPRQPQT